MRVLLIASALLLSAVVAAEENHPNITTAHGTLTLRDGVKLQTIVTRPANAARRLPAILFVQWLSCDTVAISDHPRDGWSAMLKQVVRRSNALVMANGKARYRREPRQLRDHGLRHRAGRSQTSAGAAQAT